MARYKTHAYVLLYANGKSEDSIKFKKGLYKLCTTTRLTSSVFTIAKELNDKNVPTIGNLKWHQSTIINILINEKYKGDAHLQKYYTPDFLTSRSVKNDGQIDSYYIEGNHPAIVSKDMWNKVQEEIIKRCKAKGNTAGDRKKYQNRYPLTGMKCPLSSRQGK